MGKGTTVFIAMIMAFTLTAAFSTDAAAQLAGIKAGYCPLGTCGKDGGSRVVNIKNCKKEHCPKNKK